VANRVVLQLLPYETWAEDEFTPKTAELFRKNSDSKFYDMLVALAIARH